MNIQSDQINSQLIEFCYARRVKGLFRILLLLAVRKNAMFTDEGHNKVAIIRI